MEVRGPRRVLCSGAGMGLRRQEAELAGAEGSLVPTVGGCQKSELMFPGGAYNAHSSSPLWRAGVNAGQERGNFSMNCSIVQNK